MADFDVLVAGDVWDADSGLRTDRWLAVDGGHIEGEYQSRPGTADAEYDVSTVTPGLVDMHVHLVWDGSDDPVVTLRDESVQELVVRAIENAAAQLRGGVTTVRDLGSVDDVAITVAAAVRTGRIEGPTVHASGRTIIITRGHDPFWGIESDGVDACRQSVRELRGAGADLIKVSATGGVYGQAVGEAPGASELSRAEMEAIVDEADRFGLPVAAHAVGTDGIATAIDAGVDTVEHGNLMDERSLEQLVARDIAYDPTLYVYREIASESGGAPAYARENAAGVYEEHWEVFRRALERGARVIAGSDAGSPGTPHPSLHRELACLVEAGMATEEALTAATRTAARELGDEGRGVLAPGTPADLVGFGSDPLDDVAALERPELVVKGGSVVAGPG